MTGWVPEANLLTVIASFPFALSTLTLLFWLTVAAGLFFEIRFNILGKEDAKLRLEGSSYRIVLTSLVSFSAALGGMIFGWGSEMLPLELRSPLAWVGTSLMAGGIFLRYWTVSVLGRHFTNEITILEDHRIITQGPFHLIRHPSYSGSLAFQVGAGLASCSPYALAVAFLMVLLAYPARIKREEKILVEEFGDEYRDYQERTHRLIPFLY